MNKLLWSIVPCCITFGPLFMTRIGGWAAPEGGAWLVPTGVAMLVTGLLTMLTVFEQQQKRIGELQAQQRLNAGTPPATDSSAQ